MPLDPVTSLPEVTYRYFTTNFVSGELLAEIPFRDVKYQRSLKSAGAFSGSINIIPDAPFSMDLYETTMPGKTALYVVRNDECVWAGIIWSRKYDIVTRKLDISGSEYTSYLHHRLGWKTWNHEHTATVSSSSGSCTVTLSGDGDIINDGGSVKLAFKEVGNFQYDGFYEVTSVAGLTQFSCTVPGLPTGSYTETTVTLRTDTYDYARGLIGLLNDDFSSIGFANDDIEPTLGIDTSVTNKALTSNVATLTTSAAHGALVGQTVLVSNVDSTFNGAYEVTGVPTSTSLTYAKTAANVTSTAVSANSRTVSNKEFLVSTFIATLTTSTSHGFAVGDTVVVTGVDDVSATFELFNGTHEILSTPAANTFTYSAVASADVASVACSGTAVVGPMVTVGTYGSFPERGTMGLHDDLDSQFSGINVLSVPLRGFELKNIGEVLDHYSDSFEGFEYRIHPHFYPATFTFAQHLEFLPIQLPDPPPPGEASPLSRFGAQNFIFEYPGNIQNFVIDESAEDAVTRMFVVGNIPDLGNDASQPYAGVTATDILDQGWPLLDAAESENDISDETELYAHAVRFLREAQPPIATMTMTVNGSMTPDVGSYWPGDWCGIVINDAFFLSRLQSPLEPRDDILVRKIESIKVSVPNAPTYPETVELDLISEWEVDRIGE